MVLLILDLTVFRPYSLLLLLLPMASVAVHISLVLVAMVSFVSCRQTLVFREAAKRTTVSGFLGLWLGCFQFLGFRLFCLRRRELWVEVFCRRLKKEFDGLPTSLLARSLPTKESKATVGRAIFGQMPISSQERPGMSSKSC